MPTTTEYLNDLVTQKNALVDNLVSIGISATNDEKFNSLIPKVLNVPIARGEFTPAEDNQTLLKISDLKFKPKFIAVKINKIAYPAEDYTDIYIANYIVDFNAAGTSTDYQMIGMGVLANYTLASIAQKQSTTTVKFIANDDGFECEFIFGTKKAVYVSGSKYTWFAMG